MDTRLVSLDDMNYLTQQSAGNMNMILAGMTALMDENDDKIEMMQNQTWFQRMCKTISGKNKMTRNEIQQNHDKLNAYATQAMSELFKQQCIDHRVIMSLGNQLNELYEENNKLKIMLGAFVSKLNQKIESIDNFHMLNEEIGQGVYSNEKPIIEISKILSQLDLRTLNDERKMNILKRSMAEKNILSDEPVPLISYVKDVIGLPQDEAGIIYLELSTYKDDMLAHIMLDAMENYHFLPDMTRMMKNKEAVAQDVIADNSLDSNVAISTNMLFDDLVGSKLNYVVQATIDENKHSEMEDAENLFKEYKLEDAFEKFKKLADNGNGRAMYFIGEYYAWGYKPVKKDKDLAKEWRKKGAESGDALAKVNYAYSLPKDDPEREEIYKEVFSIILDMANNNDVFAQLEIGSMYRFGYGTDKNEEECLSWYKRSSNDGFWPAERDLGSIYLDKEDYKASYDWYLKAARHGNGESQGWVGNLLDWRGDLPKDPIMANEWYKKAITDGCGFAANNLANNYKNGNGCVQDLSYAAQLYRKGMELGSDYACNALGIMYWDGNGVVQDHSKANECFKRGTELNNTWCWNNLGKSYLYGDGIECNYSKAATCLKKAVELDNSTSMVLLARCYFWGLGVDSNESKARELCQKAKSLGNTNEAEEFINLMNRRSGQLCVIENGVASYADEDNNTSSSSDGCFITTAVCGSLNKPDDCEELTILRSYRDNWLRKQPGGEEIVQEYYRIAPTIVSNIDKEDNHSSVYLDLLHNSIQPCIEDIKKGDYEKCKERYMDMVLNLKKKFYN